MIPQSRFALLGALMGAGAYSHAGPVETPPAPLPARAVDEVRHARVDIFCGHNQRAVDDIRAARRELRGAAMPVPARMFATLDRAAWLARTNQYREAEVALQSTLDQMAAFDGRA